MGMMRIGRVALAACSAWVMTTFTSGADELDLTTVGASGIINGALFMQIDPQSTGTGVFEPFVRLQANSTEEGYNTSTKHPPMDDVGSIHTHDLLFSSLGTVNLNGTDYYKFTLDINESLGGGNELLSLDSILIWRTDLASSDFDSLTDLSAAMGLPLYDLDSGGDNRILLDASLNAGSGSGDMDLLIPFSILNSGSGDYLVLYSKFGEKGDDWDSSAGFEEWAGLLGEAIPEPNGFVLAAGGLMLFGCLRRRRD